MLRRCNGADPASLTRDPPNCKPTPASTFALENLGSLLRADEIKQPAAWGCLGEQQVLAPVEP